MESLLNLTKEEKSRIKEMTTVSNKIRFLDNLGYSRSEISLELNIRYQWVRNVLITPVKNPRK